MGQSDRLLTLHSQRLGQPASATASGTGTATFTFPSPPTGLTWTGTLQCAAAPASAVFAAAVGATSWGTWQGNSVYGPVQIFANEQLIVTVTGLTANTTYVLQFVGSSDDADTVQPIFPDATSSAVSASIAGTVTAAISGAVTAVSPVINIGSGGMTTAANVLNFSYNPASANGQMIRCAFVAGNTVSLAAPEGQVQINVLNSTRGTFWEGTVDVPPRPAGANNFAPACVVPVPIPMDAGDNVGITLTLLTAGIVSPQNIGAQVDAVGAEPILGTPGLPQGVYLAGGVYVASVAVPASTPTQILAAPTRGMAYRFHGFGIAASTGPFTAYSAYIMQLQSGSGAPYAGKINVFPSTQTGACDYVPCFGQTSDVGSAVNVFQVGLVGTNPTFWVRYDTVAAPVIL